MRAFATILAVTAWLGPVTAAAPAGSPPALAQSADHLARPLDPARLHAWHLRVVSAARSLPRRSSLAELVGSVMRGANTKTLAESAIEENRTALVVIAFYVNGWPLAAILPDAREWPAAEPRDILLRNRPDLAQHFTVSALIVAFAGTPIANLAGIYKELKDARGDSGFSFSDLAADRAGTMFGDAATRSPESAERLQTRVAAGLVEEDIMPGIDGLPDNLSQEEFTRRYGGVGAPAYNQLVDDIDRRVLALSLFQGR